MRYLLDQKSYEEMVGRAVHPRDCYIRGTDYLHHIYIDGIKYVVCRALYSCVKEATAQHDAEALLHLQMHVVDLENIIVESRQQGINISTARMLGEAPPTQEESTPTVVNNFMPPEPTTLAETGLNRSFLNDHIVRIIYNKGQATGSELIEYLCLSYQVFEPLLTELRSMEYIDIIGQRGYGDINYIYVLTARGLQAATDAMNKTMYSGPCPVSLETWIDSVKAQTVRNVKVTRHTIREAFSDLIIDESILNMVGPAVNSGSSVMLFGYPGNGKTSVAERITLLMGDDIFIPHTVETDGAIIKLYDPLVHDAPRRPLDPTTAYDRRWVQVSRPVVVVGGELTMSGLNLLYNETSKTYEAPFQMKANGGIFLIDDFGRQQVRVFDLLNRWIVPLEKRYDYLTTVTGKKLQIPFDQIIMFSTNLHPNDLGDDALLRRIKFKFEIIDPTEHQWREIWKLMCRIRKVPYDDRGIDYLRDRWYVPDARPFRMCQPRDILDQMIAIARYNMERVTLQNGDLIDAACETYFTSKEKKNFGAKVRLDL
ncbi:MAG: ATPase AAA [Herpetosiphon sp.]